MFDEHVVQAHTTLRTAAHSDFTANPANRGGCQFPEEETEGQSGWGSHLTAHSAAEPGRAKARTASPHLTPDAAHKQPLAPAELSLLT